MDKPKSFSEYLAMSTADKMRLIRANESRTTPPPVADPKAEIADLHQSGCWATPPTRSSADCRLAAFLARHGEATPS